MSAAFIGCAPKWSDRLSCPSPHDLRGSVARVQCGQPVEQVFGHLNQIELENAAKMLK
jgi:hypothetical protein